ncbi:MAG: holo-ACP synthase [Azoarcus sp.]|jgi:holo-[acyl-carrier protein] synthase|nr:holo-ACP synthase [Azoarcus sp.]
MIHGIGTDIVQIERIRSALERHGEIFAFRILTEPEREEWQESKDKALFLGKRFAAKEAFGKALGTGISAPVVLHSLGVRHDEQGRPIFTYNNTLAAYMDKQGLVAHLSLSDEKDYAVAVAVIEMRFNQDVLIGKKAL